MLPLDYHVVMPVVVALVRLQPYGARMKRVSPLILSGALGLVACSSDPIAPRAPLLSLSVPTVGFTATAGGANPTARTDSVHNGGSGTLSGLAVGGITYGTGQPTGWLTATLSVTTAPAAVTLTAATGSLAVGTYTATVVVTAGVATNSPQTVSVAFTVGPPPLNFMLVSAGGFEACGVARGGAAYCWGGNFYGELGNGTTMSSTTPVAVSGGLTFTAVRAGAGEACGVTPSGAAYCWGYNSYGGLGNGTTTRSTTPVAVSGGLTFTAVSPGNLGTCGVTASGAAYCWGFGGYGGLGNGGTTTSATPVAVSGGLTFAAVSAGTGDQACGVTLSGVAFCWGYNVYGQLGNGTTTGPQQCPGSGPCSTTPVAVSGGLTFASISAGEGHTCGLTPTGAAYCWGDNRNGVLGTGDTTSSATPVAVAGGRTFASLSTGTAQTCGVTPSGAAYCWGFGRYGGLGNGDTTSSAAPVPVSGGLAFAQVSAGDASPCGVTTAGAAYCWGPNSFGNLGNGTIDNFSTTPVAVSGVLMPSPKRAP